MQRKTLKTKDAVTTIGDVETMFERANIATKTDLNSLEHRLREAISDAITDAIDGFAVIVAKGFSDIHAEMREFKNEMHEFKDEMIGFKSEMSEFKSEMLEFKSEMTEFKANVTEFKNGAEPILFSLQTDMMDVKRRLGRVETGIVELREEATSSRIAVIGILKDHEDRITAIEG